MLPALGYSFALVLAVAQADNAHRFQREFVFSATGGAAFASGTLWSVHGQLVARRDTVVALIDTMGFARTLRNAPVVLASLAWQIRPHVALTMEAGLIGIGSQQHCAIEGTLQDDEFEFHRQVCRAMDGRGVHTGLQVLLFGPQFRFATGRIQPFVRPSVGLSQTVNSFIQTNGTLTNQRCHTPSNNCTVQQYTQQQGALFSWVLAPAAGVTVRLDRRVRVRLEARSVTFRLPQVPGPGSIATELVPLTWRTMTVPMASASLEFVLGVPAGHRY